MILISKHYQYHHQQHNYLLLLSIFIVAISFYALMQKKHYINMKPALHVATLNKVVKITITPTPVVKKKIVKPKPIKKVMKKVLKKKIIKKKIIKKPIVKKIEPIKTVVAEPIVEPIVEKIVEEPVYVAEPTPVVVQKPVFDAQMKASFISGLYAMFEENKKYPRMAKRRKLEGVVEVSFTLTKDGDIKDVFVHKNSKHSILNKAALKVVNSIGFYKAIPDAVSMASLNLNIPIKYARK